MRNYGHILISLILGVAILPTSVWSGKPAKYVGATKCKICHNKKDQVKQYSIWQESAHSGAYETLGTDTAKALAIKSGIEDDPQKAKECLECHVTGYGEDTDMFADSYSMEEGVECESCHGPGSNYKSPKIMSQKKYSSQREEQHKMALEAGLIIPDEKTCLKCHNERSPAYKEFDFEKYYEKIKHKYAE